MINHNKDRMAKGADPYKPNPGVTASHPGFKKSRNRRIPLTDLLLLRLSGHVNLDLTTHPTLPLLSPPSSYPTLAKLKETDINTTNHNNVETNNNNDYNNVTDGIYHDIKTDSQGLGLTPLTPRWMQLLMNPPSLSTYLTASLGGILLHPLRP